MKLISYPVQQLLSLLKKIILGGVICLPSMYHIFRHIQNISIIDKLPGSFILYFENNVLQCNHSLLLLLDLAVFY